ncbi:class I SAM-dependent methyltransferase [Geotalea toluenoxydans]|uniref:class I SAM-dependent methyltransferase n=1 Tax=Geotalea toluenoxydans TaxID=421624 RepID=UPI000A558FD6|nr:class I SAM-dependent methyltransferase [Geotalea toluenoxydans]
MNAEISYLSSSFRDPSGFLFLENGTLFRSITRLYQQNYDHLMQSGLYNKLVESNLLLPHMEVSLSGKDFDHNYKVIQPELLSFVSYPYEWCFNQIKDAALALIEIQKQSLAFNMILKDASAYNMQFHKGKPILIDTLSFEIYKEDQPWVAYRQFCQHFLAPLSLMAFRDVRLSQLMRIYIDGLPLDLTSKLLPMSTWFNFSFLSHIHLHAKTQKRYESKALPRYSHKVRKDSLIALIHHLESAITGLKWLPAGSEWSEYYNDTNYSQKAMQHKQQLVDYYLVESKPRTVWDLGANTGAFSRIAMHKDIHTIAFDLDPAAVEKNYLQMRENKETKILPLCLDLANPTPAMAGHTKNDFHWLKGGRLILFLLWH